MCYRVAEKPTKTFLKLQEKFNRLETECLDISDDTEIDENLLAELSPNHQALWITKRNLTGDAFAALLEKLPFLKMLRLFAPELPFESLERIQGKRLHLKYLSISMTPVEDLGLFLIAKKFPHLEYLRLDVGPTTVSGFQYLVDSLKRLIYLETDHCDVSTLQIKTLAERCPCLQSLRIEHADTLRRENYIPLFHFLCEKYPHLDIQFH